MKRRFRGLRRNAPASRYDAVVIGAGVGGLVAANLLAREGLSVLLVERHYMVGGYCSTFRRGSFTFDASTHFYPLMGNPDTAPGRLLADLGARTEWVTMDPVDTFHCPDGSRFRVAANLETYRADLDREFPNLRPALDQFFQEVHAAYRHGLLAYFRGRETEAFQRMESWTVRDVLEKTFPGNDDVSRKLKLVLTGDCPHWGSPPDRTSFVFDSMLRLSYFLGNYYPVGGSQAFADELARTFEERGGHLLMSTRARGIDVRYDRVHGVDIETLRGPHTGRRLRIATEQVVSNADLGVTYDLLPEGVVPPGLRDQLRRLRPSFPCFLVHIGLRGVSADELERVQGYYWNDWDTDRVGLNGLRCKIFCPTIYDPGVAPGPDPDSGSGPGQIVILQKVLDMEGLEETELGIGAGPPDSWNDDDWGRHRQRVGSYMFRQLREVLPGIEEHVTVRLNATADTARRFTLNRAGAMLGWEMSPEQLGRHRPGLDGPVTGLTLTGHWVRPGGGIVPTLESARQAAQRVVAGNIVAV
ncbi:MAG: NAD(P)/FAD-dependent oxidoreductase [Thermoanaerobaculia bacterium]|nr:NAD(P)/FAD-dependent oxidoreductase [Thermoanaerobaculia bacterium]